MTEFLSAIYSNPHWTFIALGGLLLILELLGTGGYALWSGVSAFIVGIIAWIVPIWSMLWILFAIFTLVTAYIWWVWLKRYGGDKAEKGSIINQPQKELIGVRTVVVEPIKNGYGRVKIKDGTWSASSIEDLEVGEKVTVVDVDGLVLKVVKVS